METFIKPLEWTEEEPNWFEASAVGFGFGYAVRLTDRGTVRVRFGRGVWESFDGSIEQAQNAAQADYSSRILSALDPAFLLRVEALEAGSAQAFIDFAGDVLAEHMVLTEHKRELGKALMRSLVSRWNAARRDARTTQEATNEE